MVTYRRWYSHNVCKDFSKIKSDKGTGFILMRLFENGPMTRKEIFEGTKYGKYRPGFLSMCFTDLIEKKMITVANGCLKPYKVKNYLSGKTNTAYRAVSLEGGAPLYAITQAGRDLIDRKSLEEVSECLD